MWVAPRWRGPGHSRSLEVEPSGRLAPVASSVAATRENALSSPRRQKALAHFRADGSGAPSSLSTETSSMALDPANSSYLSDLEKIEEHLKKPGSRDLPPVVCLRPREGKRLRCEDAFPEILEACRSGAERRVAFSSLPGGAARRRGGPYPAGGRGITRWP